MDETYLNTAKALVQIAPIVLAGNAFALKGGTAINLFLREMPRLSIDLDLLVVDHKLDRSAALQLIETELGAAEKELKKRGFKVHKPTNTAGETKLQISQGGVSVKVEVNYVIRGTVFPIHRMTLSKQAQDELEAEIEIPVASIADIYGGKLVAALDRQHPRDLFDVMELLSHEGITTEIRRAFVVYLASHRRPVHEVLFSNDKDIQSEYESAFVGMTTKNVSVEQLMDARSRMMATLHADLDNDERAFLISLVQAAPEWQRLDIPHLSELPAIRWKLQNLQELQKKDPARFKAQADELEQRLKRG